MDLDLGDSVYKSSQLPVVVGQLYRYVEGCEADDRLIVSLKFNAKLHSDQETEMATDLEHSEVTDFAHFDNETAIAAVEEISDGEEKQEIESVIEVINNDNIKFDECERYCWKERKGCRKRRWSREWHALCRGSAGTYEESLDSSVNNCTANVVHRKPKKRLFAHR